MREHNNETYLDVNEVLERYGWSQGVLYYFRKQGDLNGYKFTLDKKTYWKVSELDAVKNRPPEITKPGPKPDALASLVTSRATGKTIMVGR